MGREHEINYAEFERNVFEGNVTLSQCRRMGSTHKAYGWSSTPPGSWNTEQVNAYMEGYRNDYDCLLQVQEGTKRTGR